MKFNRLLLLILIITTAFSCNYENSNSEYGGGIEKPENLISKNKMVNILYDIHLSEAFYEYNNNNKDKKIDFSSKDFYKSVLDKYGVSDSTLSVSLIYYSSFPKKYGKLYAEVSERIGMNLESVKAKNKLLEDKNRVPKKMIFSRFPYIRYPKK